tara:strand:- start:2883 stop:3575 length:693 start_codon:yes stop_codon:yes gene_type:complete
MTKAGIMQPYFFPYAQQFRHINQCDLWVIFDTPKYSRKSWLNRNRIINKSKLWSYISVPIKKKSSLNQIKEAKINGNEWIDIFFNKLKIYEKTKYYDEIIFFLKETLNFEKEFLGDLNSSIIMKLCNYFEIDTEIIILSDLNLNLPQICPPGEWALKICKELGIDYYSNAPGGENLFDKEKYYSENIKLDFYKPKKLKYLTSKFKFVEDLSVIDSLMFCGKDYLVDWFKS